MNAADRRHLTPGLGVLAALLLLLLLALWAGVGSGAHWHDAAAAPKLPAADSLAPPPPVPPLQNFAEVWQRPVFSPTRTPEKAGAVGSEASGDLQLTGVILLPDLRMAIVHDNASGQDYRVVAGQPADGGPVLVELQPRSAVVEVSGSQVRLQLVPGPSPYAGDAATPGSAARPVPGSGTDSGIVSRRGGQDSAAARAKALKARIEANRRRVQHQDDDGR